jgi:hypothetical protein
VTAVRIVLDTTAIAVYGRGSDDVGEVLRELADERVTFGVPAPCLIEASTSLTDADQYRLDVLLRLPNAVIWPLDLTEWRRVAAGTVLLGGLGRACAALPVALGQASYVLTAEPDAYGDGIETITV